MFFTEYFDVYKTIGKCGSSSDLQTTTVNQQICPSGTVYFYYSSGSNFCVRLPNICIIFCVKRTNDERWQIGKTYFNGSFKRIIGHLKILKQRFVCVTQLNEVMSMSIEYYNNV